MDRCGGEGVSYIHRRELGGLLGGLRGVGPLTEAPDGSHPPGQEPGTFLRSGERSARLSWVGEGWNRVQTLQQQGGGGEGPPVKTDMWNVKVSICDLPLRTQQLYQKPKVPKKLKTSSINSFQKSKRELIKKRDERRRIWTSNRPPPGCGWRAGGWRPPPVTTGGVVKPV